MPETKKSTRITFWGKLLDEKDSLSTKRFVTLIVTLLFIVTDVIILYLCWYVIVFSSKGKVEPALLSVLTEIIHWEAWIILGGIGLIGVSNMGQALVERAKTIAAANILTGNPSADTINVDNVNVTQKPTETGVKNDRVEDQFVERDDQKL